MKSIFLSAINGIISLKTSFIFDNIRILFCIFEGVSFFTKINVDLLGLIFFVRKKISFIQIY